MKKIKLVDNWRKAWRMASVQVSFLGVALPQVWAQLPQDQRDAVLDLVGLKGIASLISLLFALIVAVRLIQQSGLNQEGPK